MTAAEKNTLGRQKRQAFIRVHKIERGCQDCGIKNPIVLQLHHRDPENKTRNGSTRMGTGNTNWLRLSMGKIREELLKCDVVCANCHLVREYRMFHGKEMDAWEIFLDTFNQSAEDRK